MSLDRDFDEASAWVDLATTDSGVSVEAMEAYFCGDGPNPFKARETPAEASWLAAIDRMNGCSP